MKDPWRPPAPTTPEQPTRPKNGERMNLGDDIDDDMRVSVPVYFSIPEAGTICVAHPDDDTADDALLRLATCLRALADAGLSSQIANAMVRVQAGHLEFGTDHETLGWPITSSWKTEPDYEPPAALHFVNQTPRDGMVRLLRVLSAASRDTKYAPIFKKYGVRAMIR